MRRITYLLTACALLSAARTASAQQWLESAFPERSFDFGTVARGSKVHHAFKVVNRTQNDIHILSWEAKCGCTAIRVGAQDIPPGTQTVIEAVVDTSRFVGLKPSGLTLHIDRPEYARVELNLSCFIRADILLNPGQVEFGVVPRAGSPTITLNLNYVGGVPNWGVTRMQTQSPHLSAKLLEQSRTDGRATYILTATLKPDVPPGYFKDEITLFTNDPSSPTIPISVSANVQAAVTVSPSIINLGHVKPGQEVTKVVMVRATRDFKLTTLKGSRDELTGKPDPDEPKRSHLVTLKFKAPATPGPYNAVFEIGTDLQDEPPAKLTTFATITP